MSHFLPQPTHTACQTCHCRVSGVSLSYQPVPRMRNWRRTTQRRALSSLVSPAYDARLRPAGAKWRRRHFVSGFAASIAAWRVGRVVLVPSFSQAHGKDVCRMSGRRPIQHVTLVGGCLARRCMYLGKTVPYVHCLMSRYLT